MLLDEWFKIADTKLRQVKIDSHHLDNLIIAETVLGKDRSYLLAHNDFLIDDSARARLDKLLTRRLKHEPMAYITNNCHFYNREFYVDNRVLIPKPESEDFINLLEQLELNPGAKLLDIGTGSGCLAITAKLQYPCLSVYATDIDKDALQVAKTNSARHQTSINFVQSDLIPDNLKQLSIIFANLPYVPLNYKTSIETTFEPDIAIYAKNDGLEFYQKLAPLASRVLLPHGYLLAEALQYQHQNLINIIELNGFKFITSKGLVALFSRC